MLVGGAQAAVGGAADRPARLSVDRRERALPAAVREQPGPADHRPAAARLDRRPQRQADRHQPHRLPGRHHSRPARATRPRRWRSSPSCSAHARRRRPDHQGSQPRKGYQPVQVAENVPYEKYAAVTVRLPELPGSPADARLLALLSRPAPPVGHLVGYVGAASAKEYEAEKNPLLITPGFKIGKEGLEKTLEQQAARPARRPARRAHRARQAGPRARAQARPRGPDRPAGDRCRPAGICRRAGSAKNRAPASSSTA